MASEHRDAELLANNLPVSPATRTITLLEFSQHPTPNEEAVSEHFSQCQKHMDQFLSQLPNFAQHRRAIYRPLVCRRNILLPVPAGTNQHHNRTTLTWNQDAFRSTSQALNQRRPNARAFQQFFHVVHQYLPILRSLQTQLPCLLSPQLYPLEMENTNLRQISVQAQRYQICIDEKVW
jgi:hypothetical protein